MGQKEILRHGVNWLIDEYPSPIKMTSPKSSSITDLRIALGWNQAECARFLGISRSTLMHYETPSYVSTLRPKTQKRVRRYFKQLLVALAKRNKDSRGNSSSKRTYARGIKRLRRSLSFNGAECARFLGISTATLYNYENPDYVSMLKPSIMKRVRKCYRLLEDAVKLGTMPSERLRHYVGPKVEDLKGLESSSKGSVKSRGIGARFYQKIRGVMQVLRGSNSNVS